MLPENIPLHVETPRLHLVPMIETQHAPFIVELLNSAGWIQFIGDRQIRHEQDAMLYIQKINQNQSLRYWVMQLKSCGTSIGVLTLIQRTYLDHPDIGFALVPTFHQKGYCLEAADLLIKILFTDGKIKILLATTLANNVSSIKLLTNLGFQFKEEIQPDSIPLMLYELRVEYSK